MGLINSCLAVNNSSSEMCLTLIVTGWPIGTEKQGLLAVTRLKPLKELNWCLLLKRFKCTHVSYFDAFVRKKWTFQNDISSKNREISKISFQQRIRIVIDQKHFYISNGKKKIVAGQMNIFCFKIFQTKKYRMQQILYISAKTKKLFFLFNCKTFLSFLWLIVLLKNWQIRVFYPLMCFARFYLLFSEILRVTYTACFSENLECVFVQLWFKVDEFTYIPLFLIWPPIPRDN